MIDDNLMETSNDQRNSEMMDLEVAHKIGDGCPYLLKFYGALHAEVKKIFIMQFPARVFVIFTNLTM
jgi:hypothetical protein